MKTVLLAGAAATALALAAPAAHAQPENDPARADDRRSECLDRLDRLRQNLQANETFSAWYRANPDARADFIELIQAARVFAKAEMENRCRAVVAGLRQMAANAGAGEPAGRAKDPDGPGKAARDDKPARTQDPPPSDTDRARAARDRQAFERFKTARPITRMAVGAESLRGAAARNLRNEDLGTVEDLVMENGRLVAVILARGGFLGIGQASYRVAVDRVQVARAPNDPTAFVAVLDMGRDELSKMQRVEPRNGRWVAARPDGPEGGKAPTGTK